MPNGDDDFSNGADVDSAPDVGTPQPGPPPILGTPSAAPAAPPGHLFKSIISSLGVALAQGAQAGLQAPMSSQGPPIAAANAAEAPQRALEQKMSNQAALDSQTMSKMRIALTQVQLHQAMSMMTKADEEQQSEGHDLDRAWTTKLTENGKAKIRGEGSYADMVSQLHQLQADANSEPGKPQLDLHIHVSPNSTFKKQTFVLLDTEGARFTEDGEQKIGLMGLTDEEARAAGIPNIKVPIRKGQLVSDADKQYATGLNQTISKVVPAAASIKRNEANILARSTEAQKNRNFKYGLEQIKQAGANARQASKIAADSGNKDLAKAQSNVDTAANNLARTQANPKFMGELDGGQKRSVAALQRAFDDATSIRDNLLKKVTGEAPKRKVGDTVNLKNGKTARIKAINPDGSYSVE